MGNEASSASTGIRRGIGELKASTQLTGSSGEFVKEGSAAVGLPPPPPPLPYVGSTGALLPPTANFGSSTNGGSFIQAAGTQISASMLARSVAAEESHAVPPRRFTGEAFLSRYASEPTLRPSTSQGVAMEPLQPLLPLSPPASPMIPRGESSATARLRRDEVTRTFPEARRAAADAMTSKAEVANRPSSDPPSFRPAPSLTPEPSEGSCEADTACSTREGSKETRLTFGIPSQLPVPSFKPAATTFSTAEIFPGSTRILVASSDGFSIGDTIRIGDASGPHELKVVNGFGSISVHTPMARHYPAGTVISKVVHDPQKPGARSIVPATRRSLTPGMLLARPPPMPNTGLKVVPLARAQSVQTLPRANVGVSSSSRSVSPASRYASTSPPPQRSVSQSSRYASISPPPQRSVSQSSRYASTSPAPQGRLQPLSVAWQQTGLPNRALPTVALPSFRQPSPVANQRQWSTAAPVVPAAPVVHPPMRVQPAASPVREIIERPVVVERVIERIIERPVIIEKPVYVAAEAPAPSKGGSEQPTQLEGSSAKAASPASDGGARSPKILVHSRQQSPALSTRRSARSNSPAPANAHANVSWISSASARYLSQSAQSCKVVDPQSDTTFQAAPARVVSQQRIPVRRHQPTDDRSLLFQERRRSYKSPAQLNVQDDIEFVLSAFDREVPLSDGQWEIDTVVPAVSSSRSGLIEDAAAAYEAAVKAGRRAATRLGRVSGLASQAAIEEIAGKFPSGGSGSAQAARIEKSAGAASTTASEVSWPAVDLARDPNVQIQRLLRQHGDGSRDCRSTEGGAQSDRLSLARTLQILRESISSDGVALETAGSGVSETSAALVAALTLSESECTPPAMPPPRRQVEDDLGTFISSGSNSPRSSRGERRPAGQSRKKNQSAQEPPQPDTRQSEEGGGRASASSAVEPERRLVRGWLYQD